MANKFLHEECKETRTWEQIASEGKTSNFKTGGLNMSPDTLAELWAVWACWRDHPCLQKLVDAVAGDYMCFVYHEIEKAWYPWGIKRVIGEQAMCRRTNVAPSV